MTQPQPLATDDAHLVVTRPEPQIAVLKLHRPKARNALSLALIKDVHAALLALGDDATCAAIILAADGPVFCSGHDLKELTSHRTDADGGRAFFHQTMTSCSAMMQAVVTCAKPIIAAVQGTATAAGCQLVASADLAVASNSAQFATPGVNIGLFCSTPMVALSRNVPRKRAMEMLLLGEALSAEEAATYGLINRVVSADQVSASALDYARRIALKSKATVAVGKATFYRQIEAPLHEAYADASAIMVANMMSLDAHEGICAFIEKRDPVWKDK